MLRIRSFKLIKKADQKSDATQKNDEEDVITTDLVLPIETDGDNVSKNSETTRIIRTKTNLRTTLILK